MKYFVSYSAEGVPVAETNASLMTVRQSLENQDAEVYCTRFLKEKDYQEFQPQTFEDYMHNAYRRIRAANRLFLLAASPHVGTGLLLELGCAKGAGLPVIVANRISAAGDLLSGHADYVFNYKTDDELRSGIADIPSSIEAADPDIRPASPEARRQWQQYIRNDLPPLQS